MAMGTDAGQNNRPRSTLLRFLLLFLPVALVLLLTIYVFYRLETDNEKRLLQLEQRHQVQLEKEALAGILDEVVVEARVQAQHEILESLHGPPGPRQLNSLARELSKVLKTTNAYQRILYIDRNGEVLLRLARQDGGSQAVREKAHGTPPAMLWERLSRELPPDKVYLAALDRQDDNAAVIRVAAPVTNDLGEREGLLVMDYRASRALRKMAGLYFSRGLVLLLDRQGHILLGGRSQGSPRSRPGEPTTPLPRCGRWCGIKLARVTRGGCSPRPVCSLGRRLPLPRAFLTPTKPA